MSMKLFDSHCHLQDERLFPDIDSIIERAVAAGVSCMACCGTSEADWNTVECLAQKYYCVHPSYGLHPWYVGDRSSGWLERLRGMLLSDQSAGIGEAGLDHGLKERNDLEQEQIFRQQLELALEFSRPISIHCRQAWGALMPILSEYGLFPAGFVIHSYSGSSELFDEIFRLNGYVSFSGTITRSGNKRGHKNVVVVPLERLLIETDSPDMLPVMRDRNDAGENVANEPMHLHYALEAIASLRGMAEADLADATHRNAEEIFVSACAEF